MIVELQTLAQSFGQFGFVGVCSQREFGMLRRKPRQPQRELEEQEAEIESLESRIATLTSALEDPELYTRPAGVDEAKMLGMELERLKRQLDGALARWTAASDAVSL